jgi:hypothetical protein
MRGAPRRLADRADIVMRVVERRTDQIVHAGVDDDEGLGLAALHVKHARDQDAGIADDQPAGLEDQLAVEIAGRALDDRRIGIRDRAAARCPRDRECPSRRRDRRA